MDRERQRWMDEESRNKKAEEDNQRRYEEKSRREKMAVQQLHYADIETLKQQHAEQVCLLKTKCDADRKEEVAALRHLLDLQFNERERQFVDAHRKDKEEEALVASRHLSHELQRQHVLYHLVFGRLPSSNPLLQ